MEVTTQLLSLTVTMIVLMFVVWLIQRLIDDAGVVDVAWSAGLGIAALFYSFTSDGYEPRRILLAILAGSWSARLAVYLLIDRVLRGEEDGRYQGLRKKWGSRTQFNLLLFFEFQALLVVLFSLPFLIVAHYDHPSLTIFDLLGTLIFICSIVGETVADRQLAQFRSAPSNKGKTCRKGLWKYSRHPNYFFEWLHWWSYVLIAFGAPFWWITLSGPALMLFFLFKITGIPATEERALESRGEDYRNYQETTSMFIPWFPKENRN